MIDYNVNKCYLVGVDFSRGENTGVLIVGEQVDGKVNVINAFEGEEAYALFKKLITKKENNNA